MAVMARVWTCAGCRTQWPRTKQRCSCGRKRPAARHAAHKAALDVPYEQWVERFGEVCGICGCGPSENRRLDRDHDHASGEPRGLLCHRCNRALPNHITAEWLEKALAYLQREDLMAEGYEETAEEERQLAEGDMAAGFETLATVRR